MESAYKSADLLTLFKVRAYQGPRIGIEPIPGAPFFSLSYDFVSTERLAVLIGAVLASAPLEGDANVDLE